MLSSGQENVPMASPTDFPSIGVAYEFSSSACLRNG
jgi:hypothetical protein